MTKEECIKGLQTEKSDDEWLEFEKEYLETLSQEDREEIGLLALPMIERCGAIKYFRNQTNEK